MSRIQASTSWGPWMDAASLEGRRLYADWTGNTSVWKFRYFDIGGRCKKWAFCKDLRLQKFRKRQISKRLFPEVSGWAPDRREGCCEDQALQRYHKLRSFPKQNIFKPGRTLSLKIYTKGRHRIFCGVLPKLLLSKHFLCRFLLLRLACWRSWRVGQRPYLCFVSLFCLCRGSEGSSAKEVVLALMIVMSVFCLIYFANSNMKYWTRYAPCGREIQMLVFKQVWRTSCNSPFVQSSICPIIF